MSGGASVDLYFGGCTCRLDMYWMLHVYNDYVIPLYGPASRPFPLYFCSYLFVFVFMFIPLPVPLPAVPLPLPLPVK
jgi:hypothetical protein